MSKRDNRWKPVNNETHIYVEGPKGISAAAKARAGETKIKADIQPTGRAHAWFLHSYISGRKRDVPDGLELVLKQWLINWEYGELSLQAYLNKIYGRKWRWNPR